MWELGFSPIYTKIYIGVVVVHANKLLSYGFYCEKPKTITFFPSKLISSGFSFDNEPFESFCENHGIIHELSSSRTPQHNEVVERKNISLQ